MAGPLSNDLRERVVSAVLAGQSCHGAASRFGVSVSSAIKWSWRYRQTGSVAPGQMGGHRRPVLSDHRAFILERISQTPHLTLHGLKPTPVVDTIPNGTAIPKACVAWSTSPDVQPGFTRTVALAGSTWTAFIIERSIIRPSSTLPRPGPLCPPPRMAMSRALSRPKTWSRWRRAQETISEGTFESFHDACHQTRRIQWCTPCLQV